MKNLTNTSLADRSNHTKKAHKNYARRVVIDLLVKLLTYIGDAKTRRSKDIRLDLVLCAFAGDYMMGIADVELAKKHKVSPSTIEFHRREFERRFPLVRTLAKSVS